MLELLRDVNFFSILEATDRELAKAVREAPCPVCGGPMHVGNFPRKERGPAAAQRLPLSGLRLSFCCGHCRERRTPESVRFLGRRVYVEVVFVLACVLPPTSLPEPTPVPAVSPEPEAAPPSETASLSEPPSAPEPETTPMVSPEPSAAPPAPTLAAGLPTKRTLSRWKKWWREAFPHTPVWQAMLGRILPPVDPATLPGELLNRYPGIAQERLLRLLRLLLPLSVAAPS